MAPKQEVPEDEVVMCFECDTFPALGVPNGALRRICGACVARLAEEGCCIFCMSDLNDVDHADCGVPDPVPTS